MKSTRNIIKYVYWLIIMATIAVLGGTVAYVSAYFTATASKSGEMQFHTVMLQVNTPNENNALFAADFADLVPGDTLNFNNVSVQNTGSADVYSLVNLTINVTTQEGEDFSLSEWYNLDGASVNALDVASNTTQATELLAGASKTLNLTYNFAGAVFNDSYQNADYSVTIRAVAIQAQNLEPINSLTDDALIASRMLIDQYGAS